MKSATAKVLLLLLSFLQSTCATRRPPHWTTPTPGLADPPSVSDFPHPPYFRTDKLCGQNNVCSCDDSKNVGKMSGCIGVNCFCDDACEEHDDCCQDYQPEVIRDRLRRPWIDSVVACVSNTQITEDGPFLVVNKCPSHAEDMEIVQKCYRGDKSFEMFGERIDIPVYGKKSKFLYTNVYCSICNEEYDVRFMKAKGVCPPPTPLRAPEDLANATDQIKSAQESLLANATTSRGCRVTEFTLPNWKSTTCKTKTYRSKVTAIDQCSTSNETEASLCSGYTSMVSDTLGNQYKNWHCAMCNRVHNYLSCGMPLKREYTLHTGPVPLPYPPVPEFSQGNVRYRPISLLFSVNGKGKSSSLVEVEKDGETVRTVLEKTNCPDGQLSLANKCYDIYCGKDRIFRDGKCTLQRMPVSSKAPAYEDQHEFTDPSIINVTLTEYIPLVQNCQYIHLKEDQYNIFSNGTLSIHRTGFLLNDTYYRNVSVNGTSFLQACVPNEFLSENITQAVNRTFPIFRIAFDETEALVSLIGQIISIVSLTILIIVYSVFRALRNTPGLCIMSLSIALLFAQLLFVTGIAQLEEKPLCYAIGVAIHYFFLASFFWMNVVAYDLCSVFACTKGHSESKSVIRFLCYSMYGWVSPLLVVSASIVLDIYEDQLNMAEFNIVPKYANGLCFITNRDSLLILFVVPAGVLTVANFVLFFITVCGIHSAMKTAQLFQQAKQKQCKLLLYMKLAAIMGLTWIFGFLQSLTDAIWSTYIFIIMNSLQGLFICLAFVFTRKVFGLLQSKCKRKTKPSTSKMVTSDSQKPFLNSQSSDYPTQHTEFMLLQMETSL